MNRPAPRTSAFEPNSFWRSLRIALHGAAFVLRTERNARIQATIGLIVAGLGLLLHITAVEWAILFVLMSAVLALEAINTAVEAIVDLVTDDRCELARIAKDTAAGAVVIMAIGSVGVAVAIFLPRLWGLLFP